MKSTHPQIKNKKLIIRPTQTTNVILTSHEKHFKRENKAIVEFYHDDFLDHYSEIERLDNLEKTECFGKNGKLFSRIIIEFEAKGKPIKENQYIEKTLSLNMTGLRTKFNPLQKFIYFLPNPIEPFNWAFNK